MVEAKTAEKFDQVETARRELGLLEYEDAQYQNSDPIPDQKPVPENVWICEISWDRTAGFMRMIIPALEGESQNIWWFKELLGKCQILGTDNMKGRIVMRGIPCVENETLAFRRDPDAKPYPVVEGGEYLPPTHNRLCYFRNQRIWRVRDERGTQKAYEEGTLDQHPELLRYTSSLRGDAHLEFAYEDIVAHIYHKSSVILREEPELGEGVVVCHLYDESLQVVR